MKLFDTLYAFKFYATHFAIILIDICFHLKNVNLLVLKGIRPVEILYKSSWRTYLSSQSEITKFMIFMSSVNFAMKLQGPTFMSFMYIIQITLIQEQDSVWHQWWLMPKLRPFILLLSHFIDQIVHISLNGYWKSSYMSKDQVRSWTEIRWLQNVNKLDKHDLL